MDYRSLDLPALSFDSEMDLRVPPVRLSVELGSDSSQAMSSFPLSEVSRPSSFRETIALEDDGENSEMSLYDLRETLTALEPALTIPLNEILIVRIENGNDFFLTVSTSFGPTHSGVPPSRHLPHSSVTVPQIL